MPEEGWYEDPFQRHRFRFWDGTRWSAYAADDEVVWDEVDPAGSSVVDTDTAPALPGFSIVVAGYFVGLALAFGVGALLHRSDDPDGRILRLLATQFALWTGLVGACVIVSKRKGTGSLVRDFDWRFRKIDIGLGLAGAFAGRVAGAIAVIPIPLPFRDSNAPDRDILDRLADRPIDWIVMIAIVCIGAPLIEELFFRGVMQPRLVQTLGTVPGLALTALLFGAAHLTNWQGWQLTFVYAWSIAAGGVVLGLMRHTSGRLGPSTFAHFFFNAQAVALVALLT